MLDPFDWQGLYPAGLARDANVPEAPLWHALGASARQHPDRVAVRFDGREIRYRELWTRVREIADALGPGEGERVALCLPNRPEFVAWYHGALKAGRVVVAVNPQLTSAEIAAIVEDAQPSVAVVAEQALDAFPRTAAIRVIGGRTEPGTIRPRATQGAEAASDPADEARQTPHARVAVLQYTSGTTGGLKAAEMTHANLLANAWQNDAWFAWTEKDVILGALPLCHTWGMGCVMNGALLAGATIALVEHFDPERVLDVIARDGVTVAYGSATMFHRLLDAAGPRAAEIFRNVRYVKAGAMLVGGDLPRRWADAVPAVPMVLGYGLTEASPEVTNNPLHARRPGTVGIPLPRTELRLCAADDPSREVALGEEGEIHVRGPQVMRGYWRRPEATAATLLPGGWLRTGDLGRFDDAGYLVIVDRLKDLIKFRGNSVVPAEVERALLTHPAVAEACVVGAPHPVDGEMPVAFVRFAAGACATAAELDAHLESSLARFKHPRDYRFVEEIPKNHVGKPLRRVLRERAASPR
jgi:long-chain acyl-CoA synthetase